MKKYMKLMRLHHYMKNLLILCPLVFSGNLFDIENFYYASVAFFSFGFMASTIYIINDIEDIEYDKEHQ